VFPVYPGTPDQDALPLSSRNAQGSYSERLVAVLASQQYYRFIIEQIEPYDFA
jgi:hypothetical protein